MTQSKIKKVLSKMPSIETERLLLRKIVPSDYKDMYEYSCRDEVTKYLLWNPHPSEEYTYMYLEQLSSSYRRGEFSDWAIVLKSTGKMIGTCGYTSYSLEHRRIEIGYVLSPDFWGNGYAVEAANAAIGFAFSELGFNRAEVHFIEGNTASIKVAEKLGLHLEGYFRQYMMIKGEYKNIGIAAITADEFGAASNYYKKPNAASWLSRLINT